MSREAFYGRFRRKLSVKNALSFVSQCPWGMGDGDDKVDA